MRPSRILPFLVALLVLLSALPAMAQDDVLFAADAPDPALCTLEARTIEGIRQLIEARTVVPLVTPTSLPDPFVMPEGFALMEDERLEVEKDLRRAVACFNTGNPLKVFATYTDDHVLRLIDRLGGLTAEVASGLETIRPLDPDQYILILAINEAVLLPGGRVAVEVFGDDPTDANPPGLRLFYMKEVAPGRWFIDDVVEIPH